MRYAVASAKSAVEAAAHAETAQICRAALALLDDLGIDHPTWRLRLLLLLFDSDWLEGHGDEQESILLAALEAAERSEDLADVAEAGYRCHVRVGTITHDRVSVVTSVRQRVVGLLERFTVEDDPHALLLRSAVAGLLGVLGDHDAAHVIDELERLYAAALRTGDERAIGLTAGSLAAALGDVQADPHRRATLALECFEAARLSGDFWMTEGSIAEALHAAVESADFALVSQLRERYLTATASARTPMVEYDTGLHEFGDAVRAGRTEHAIAVSKRLRASGHTSEAFMLPVRLLVTAQMRGTLAQVGELLEGLDEQLLELVSLRPIAAAMAVERGDLEAAARLYVDLGPIPAARPGMGHKGAVVGLSYRAIAAAGLEVVRDCEELETILAPLSGRLVSIFSVGCDIGAVDMFRGLLADALGSHDDADGLFADATTLHDQTGDVLQGATGRHYWARSLVVRGRYEDAAPLIRDGLEAARFVGTSSLIESLESLEAECEAAGVRP